MSEPVVSKTLLQKAIFVSLVVAVPHMTGFFFQENLQDSFWVQVPFHSAVEAAGAVVALVLAALILSSSLKSHVDEAVFFAFGLLAMGTLDLFHSFVGPGGIFIWLHSLATFAGGIFTAGLFLLYTGFSLKGVRGWAITIFMVAALVGIASILWPEIVPDMVIEDRFTFTAIFLNVVGGSLFLCAAVAFLVRGHLLAKPEFQVFSILCAFFGVSGVFFQMSLLWDFDWWLWHAERVFAYLCALAYIGYTYRETQRELHKKFDHEEIIDRMNKQQRILEKNNWIKDGLAELVHLLRGLDTVEEIAEKGLSLIARRLNAKPGVFYVVDENADPVELTCLCSYACDLLELAEKNFRLGQGLVGEAAARRERLLLRDIPEGYLPLRSGLGKASPRYISVSPVVYENHLLGALELGLNSELSARQTEFLDQALMHMAIVLSAARSRQELEAELSESNRLREELEAQAEELRVASEELSKHQNSLK